MATNPRRFSLILLMACAGVAAAIGYTNPEQIAQGADYNVDDDFRPRPPGGEFYSTASRAQEEIAPDPFVDDPSAGEERVRSSADAPVAPSPGVYHDDHAVPYDCEECVSSRSNRRRQRPSCDAACDSVCNEPNCSQPRCDRPCLRCQYGDLDCCQEETWRLFQHWNRCDWEAHGWVSQGITTSDEGPASNFNGVVSFNDREEEYQLNQAYVTFAKNAVTDGCGWAIGGRVDFMYGSDARFTEARGLEKRRDLSPHWNGQRFYGIALPQAYAEVALNNLSVKFGHFYTIVGYEVVTSPDNFFYSHAYTMQYGEPFTHTGMLATYDVTENLKFMGGVDRGWDNWEDDDYDRISTLAGVSWQSDNGWAIGFSGTAGQEPTSDGLRNDDRTFYSAVISKQINERWSVVTQHDRGFQDRGVSATQDAEWYGVAQYIYYKVNCCLTAGVRMEWFRDDDGTRVAAVGDRLTPNSNPTSGGGFTGDFFGLTAGLNWSPNGNLIVRPELRFDWFEPDANSNLPFDDGNSDDLVTGAVDVILLF
ncbi:MAG: porin [Planctomycetales bacterium]|nr:porin [Planctomycetales bacterium]